MAAVIIGIGAVGVVLGMGMLAYPGDIPLEKRKTGLKIFVGSIILTLIGVFCLGNWG